MISFELSEEQQRMRDVLCEFAKNEATPRARAADEARGAYPSMSLAQAREIFKRDFADIIQKGRSIKIATDAGPGTVADLLEGYVASQKAAGKQSWKEAEKGLNEIANTLGRNRLAREIEPEEIVELIRPIHERGARAMAAHVRSYIHSDYSWA